MRTMIGGLWTALLLTALSLPAETTFSSGPHRVAVIELFTSEGCSSCPPADAWLAGLRDRPGLWRDFVPVGWHVNYWDKLGWKDIYATKAFTSREYAYASFWEAGSVYTPCFVRNGAEWRRDDDELAASTQVTGNLTATWQEGRRVTVHYAPPKAFPYKGYVVTVTLLGGGITSDVRAGENSGRKLAHEFVALQTVSVPLEEADDGSYGASFTLRDEDLAPAPQHALAVWVSVARMLTPIQATGGWLVDRAKP